MTHIITNQRLDKILRLLISQQTFYYEPARSYFEDLYNTGCRSQEPLAIERWKQNGKMVICNTSKTEAIRFFDESIISDDLRQSIYDGLPPYGGLTYDQLTAVFRRYITVHPIYSGKRIADTYLFRYNRARLIFDKTNSLEAVVDYFGWSNQDIAANYIITPLTFNDELPF